MNNKPTFQKILNHSLYQYATRTAVQYGEHCVSYSELARRAARVTQWLLSKELKNGCLIGIYLKDRLGLIVSIIGILNARCVFVALDDHLPIKRLDTLIETTGIQVLLTDQDGRQRLRTETMALLDEEFFNVQPGNSNHDNVPSLRNDEFDREDPIYIYFTSGSTGLPKAILGRNKGLLHFLEWEAGTFEVDEQYRFSQFTAPGFDAFLRDVFTPLLKGAVLCIPDSSDILPDRPRLIHWIHTRHITLIHCVPSVFRLINGPELQPEHFPGLKYVIMSGERIPPGQLDNWYRVFGQRIALVNLYGTSETTMAKTCYFVRPADSKLARIPVGKAIRGARVFVLNEDMDACPRTVAGEVYIRTPFRTLGYYNNPKANEECFIPNPFTGGHNDLFHKTGDIGRFLEDDNLDIIGRLDSQVKIRGVRVEPQEIESQLSTHPQVDEAVVTAGQNKDGETFLCAYFIAENGASDKHIDVLKEYLAERFPEYMVPQYFIPMESFPLTPNLKIDRKALPEPRMETGEDYVPPENGAQRALVEIWAEVLGIGEEVIGIQSNFFRLGGHSLKATFMVEKIHRRLNVKLPLAEVFKNTTISELARYIAGAEEEKFSSIQPVEKREYYPLSSAQKRIYILQQMDLQSTVYNMTRMFPLPAEVDSFRQRLEESFLVLLERHEALRTAFLTVDDQPVQRVFDTEDIEFSLEYRDAEGDREQALSYSQQFVRPFDLGHAPLLRVGLMKMKEGEYLLMSDMHHIISDGVSLTLLERDIVAIFSGRSPEPLKIQYKDFSHWQNSEKEHDNTKRREKFWLDQLKGELAVLDLPLDYPRPEVRRFEGAMVSFEIGAVETAKLKTLAMNHNATLYMVLLAVYNIFLGRICGQDEVIVGAPIAGRRHADLESIIGMFVNTLALRNFPSAGKTFQGFLEELRDRSIQAFDNQEYQFEDLVDRLDVPRDAARNPLFDVTYIMQNIGDLPLEATPPQPQRQAVVETGEEEQRPGYHQVNPTAKFDLTLIINERPNSLAAHFQYSTHLFKEQTIHRFIQLFKTAVSIVTERPERELAALQLISAEEKKRILEQFNDTSATFPRHQTLHGIFAEQASKTPDAIALCGVREDYFCHLSYHRLHRRSALLARYLREKGAGPGSIAALLMERSIDMLVAILAVLKTGAAYLPLDPALPQERIYYMLNDSAAPLVLTRNDLENIFQESRTNGNHDLEDRSNASHLAYIIYTSGSTGRPKGVMVEHRAAVNVTGALIDNVLYSGNSQSNYSHPWHSGSMAPFVFDASVLHLFGSLLSGNALHLVPDATRRDGLELIEFCRKHHLDVLEGSPGHLSIILEAAENTGFPQQLKHIIVGGEALPERLAARMTGMLGAEAPLLTNMYGPTECTVAATSFCYSGGGGISGLTVPIGKPMNNYRVYILDRQGNLQPIGIPGELFIGGDGLARGYLNNPDLTASRFPNSKFRIPDSSEKRSSGGTEYVYKTGDLGRWLPDGNIEFLGRKDFQVKIRGFRIELGEIEYQCMKQTGVKEAVVTLRQQPGGDGVLCAYIVPRSGHTLDEASLKAGLSASLPAYMVPSLFVSLKQLPLNSSGKVDRKALPAPDQADSGEYHAPATPLERQLVQIWAGVLGLDPENLSVTADFFKLGGQSLKATIMVSRVHRRCNVRLPLTELFRSPTIRQLAGVIEGFEKDTFTAVPPTEKREYYPLSSAQKRIYVLQQVDPQSTVYNIPLVQSLEGFSDIAKLEEIFQALVLRHESLRTSIQVIEGEAVQRVHDEVKFSVRRIGPIDTRKSLKGLIRPFDLRRAPLIRVIYSGGGEGKGLLIVDMHHIIADGFSLDILSREFMMLAGGRSLPRLKLQYKDYSLWQNSGSQRYYIKRQEEYWIERMQGEIPVLELPLDFSRPEVQDFSGNSISFTIANAETAKLRALARQQNATIYMVFLAVFNVFLSRLSGGEEIFLGAPIAGRRHAGLEHIIGMFVNTLVLRNFPQGGKSFLHFLQDVKESTLDAFENQEYPFEDLVEKIEINRDTGRNPLFDVVFVLQNTGEIPPDGPSGDSSGERSINRTAKFDLSLMMQERRDSFKAVFQYSTSLFKDETMRRWIEYFKHMVRLIAADPTRKLSHIDLISSPEKKRILEEFNRTRTLYPKDKTIHQLFEEQAGRTPYGTALAGLNKASGSYWSYMSYSLLNEEADLLAKRLRQKGAGPGVIIALKMERSLEMIIAIMAILKTGGAYLPIETGFPQERIQYMLDDSAASLLTGHDGVHSLRPVQGLEETCRSSSLAYIIYTSGSTGKPKGVLTTHYNVTRVVKNTNYIDINEHDRLLQLSNYAFDGSVFDIYGALLNGAALVLPPPEQAADVASLTASIQRESVNIFFITSALFNLLVDSGVDIFKHIRKIIAGGDRLSVPHVRNALALSGKGKLLNGYGPTETTVFATYFPIDELEPKAQSIPIGYPLANTTVYLLDKWLNPVPIGVNGEIYIGGTGIARGYLNNPELTSERFIMSPFEQSQTRSQNSADALYKTGDLGRMRPDGAIEFLGRIDRQIKLRGYRVEIGEIENYILATGQVRETVVTLNKDKSGEEYLCAYVTTAASTLDAGSKSLDVSAVKQALSRNLPAYMMPSFFVELAAIPLNANGKVDTRALPKPETKGSSEYIAPADGVEETVARIWQEVLGIEKVSVMDDFFEIGGHSLKGVRIANELHKAFDMDIRLTALFRERTVGNLARFIKKAARVRYQSIRPVEKKEYYPVSSTQKRLYLVQQMDPASIAYNMPSTYPMAADQLDAAKLESVLKQLVARHESLRTSFIEIEGQTVQRILEPREAVVELERYELPPTVPDYMIEKHLNQAFVRPFDLSAAPLLRVRITAVREQHAVLSVDTHHIIYDEVSQEVLGREVLALYSGETLEPPKLQYKDFSQWQNREIQSGRLKQQEAYWLSQFEDDYPRLSIPLDFDRPAIQHFGGRRASFILPSEDETQLGHIASDSGCTMFIVYLALFNVLLSRLSGQDDIVVGTAVAGRTHPDLQNIIGMFVNTLAIRNFPRAGKTFSGFLADVEKQALDAFENQDYPFESLVNKIEPSRPMNRNPVFDVLFSYHQSDTASTEESNGEINLPEEHEECDSKFDLTLNVTRAEKGSIFAFKYNTALFRAQTIERMITLFKNIVKTVAHHPGQKLSELMFFDEAEKDEIFADSFTDLEEE